MKLVEFPEQNVIFAKDQPEYRPLPAHRFMNEQGEIACCWELTWRERLQVLFTGRVWHRVWTFYQPLQPQLLQVQKPDMSQDKSKRVTFRFRWKFGFGGKKKKV